FTRDAAWLRHARSLRRSSVIAWARRRIRAVGLALGVIGAADERPRFHVAKAELPPYRRQLGELLGVIVLLDGQVLCRRPEILAEREDLDADPAQVAHGGDQLVARLATPEERPRLRRRPRPPPPRGGEGPGRPPAAPAVPGELVEARDRLGVVVQDVRTGRDYRLERGGAALEVWNEHLHPAA